MQKLNADALRPTNKQGAMRTEPSIFHDEAFQLSKNLPALVYFLSTLFMVFFSVHAIKEWPNLWAQGSISLACTLPALVVFIKEGRSLIRDKKWPYEVKLSLVIVALGFLNICFSEDQVASLKGMGLFLMSGILAFNTALIIFKSKNAQKRFICLYSLCFAILLGYGAYEFIRETDLPLKSILLFSLNPIPAGSLLILLSIGPLTLFAKAQKGWEMFLFGTILFAGVLITVLLAQRGPVLALMVMALLLAGRNKKGLLAFSLALLILTGIGYQLKDKIPSAYKNRILKKETLLVRMEFYYIAFDILREKPLFGLGFNSPLSRFIPYDYESKIYPRDSNYSFYASVPELKIFDNMILSLLGEAGGLFTVAYFGLFVYLLKNLISSGKYNTNGRAQAWLLFVVLAGFICHSMTFDSLKYPHLNWIFHSLLGLMANCQVPMKADSHLQTEFSDGVYQSKTI